jgi:hypothetical protein
MRYFSIAMVVIICLAIGGCTKPPAETILFDFETDEELDRFAWRCHTMFSLSHEHAIHGMKSLRFELFPTDNPGMAPVDFPKDWRGYKNFCFDVYSVQDDDIFLEIRIDDRDDAPDYSERYNDKLLIRTGANTVCLPCDSLVTSGTKRKMSLKNIFLIDLFMTKPDKKIILYFDYFRLVR